MARFAVGDGVVFPIFHYAEGGPYSERALGVVIEVLTAGGISYNIRDLATGKIHGVIHKCVKTPDLLTRLAVAAMEPPKA